MVDDVISIRYFHPSGQEVVTKEWPTKSLKYVEELIFEILASIGIGPLYRTLFGIRLVARDKIWLAPNENIHDLLKNLSSYNLDHKRITFELRMRFRPSSYTRMAQVDVKAFDVVYAQIRYDFLHTKFSNEKRDFILLDESVLGMIASDLLRHALEYNISVSEIFNQVNIKDFIPQRASKWQKSLLFHLDTLPSSIQAFIEMISRSCDGDIKRVKQGSIELFLDELCKNYGAESYSVLYIDHQENEQPKNIRVRYEQNKDQSLCLVESQASQNGSSSKSLDDWTELCEIESLCYGTLRQNIVEINRSNKLPFRLVFKTPYHAKSFLSLLDGYYRLMKKWQFNFCRTVSSPELEKLKKERCHGPIGYETMRYKLPTIMKPGTFLIRQCMEKIDHFMIDVISHREMRLCLNVVWDPVKKLYSVCSNAIKNFTVIVNQEGYPYLRALVYDLQIKSNRENGVNIPPLQLKYWIPPSEYDDCPALLLSISRLKFKEFDLRMEKTNETLSDLPHLIPKGMIRFSRKLRQTNNRTLVRAANLSDKEVVVKEYIAHACSDIAEFESSTSNDLILNMSYEEAEKHFLHPLQQRLREWVFIRSPYFAETIGMEPTCGSLIQEYFPLGSLDELLSKRKEVTDLQRRSVGCQLAHALLYLQEKRIIHGKIRCHNVYIKSFNSGKDIQVKITDPLGTFDADKDLAFLAPEYFRCGGGLNLSGYHSGIDVWALGTTMWQIYSHGIKPPERRYANTLTQPRICPDDLWAIIESCWIIDQGSRASPQSIFRDINDSYTWDKICHEYDYILLPPNTSNQPPMIIQNGNDRTSSCVSRTSMSNTETNSSRGGSQSNLLPIGKKSFNNNLKDVNSITKVQKIAGRSWRMIFPRNKSPKTPSQEREDSNDQNSMDSRCNLSYCSLSSNSTATSPAITEPQNTDLTSNHWYINSNNLRLGPEIGRGSSGVVIKGVLFNWGGLNEQVVAVKQITDLNDINQSDDLRREFELLKSLDHKNIVKTLGFVDESSVMLVVEYLPLGSLLSFIRNSHHDHLLSLPLKKYALDIAQGMEYLESKKIVHRDLALRNILLKNPDEVKICDFGLAQYTEANNHYQLKTERALPLRWYAPEVLVNWTFTHKTDVWSYGIVLWEIYSGGCSPQYSGTSEELSETLKHERLLMPRDCPEVMYNLMLSCWAYNPDDRDTFTQISERLASISDLQVKTTCDLNKVF